MVKVKGGEVEYRRGQVVEGEGDRRRIREIERVRRRRGRRAPAAAESGDCETATSGAAL
uniref:Uncharacterized protein n=1 Tax=Cucumis melo TaxID=3656 RepID=A0A9I9DZB0_CUCME